jgi:vacuolar-type H+-ATPase subunit F/Vma7
MDGVIFIGDRHCAEAFRAAGVLSFAPALGQLAERVRAERVRCRVLAMTEATFEALPKRLASELREGPEPALALFPEPRSPQDHMRMLTTVMQRAKLDDAAIA